MGEVSNSVIGVVGSETGWMGPAVVGRELARIRVPDVDLLASASSFLSAAARKAAAEAVGLSSSLLFLSRLSLILRMEPRRDLDDPCVSDLMMGKVVLSRAEFPFSPPPDLFEGCWTMLYRRGG